MIGFVAGAAITVRNSIILVDFIELRRAQGMGWKPSRNRELPPAILAGSCVRRTVQTGRANSRIDSRGERFELNAADTFAREIRQAFAAPGFLHSTEVHEEAQMLTII